MGPETQILLIEELKAMIPERCRGCPKPEVRAFTLSNMIISDEIDNGQAQDEMEDIERRCHLGKVVVGSNGLGLDTRCSYGIWHQCRVNSL